MVSLRTDAKLASGFWRGLWMSACISGVCGGCGPGFVDLTTAVTQMGVDLAVRQLRAVAISDDGRVVTGSSFDASAPFASRRAFYAVLPASLFE